LIKALEEVDLRKEISRKLTRGLYVKKGYISEDNRKDEKEKKSEDKVKSPY
jgi:hypothetical protein